jgi:hypothetical protein
MKNSILVLCLSLVCLVSCKPQEGENIFSYQNGQVFAKEKFIKIEDPDRFDDSFPEEFRNDVFWHIYQDFNLKTLDEECNYTLSLLGTMNASELPFFDAYALQIGTDRIFFCQGSRHHLNNLTVLTNNLVSDYYLQVHLNDECFALIFGGFRDRESASEMQIVVVNKNQATLVYDGLAYITAYTPYPNFSIEFVETLDWVIAASHPAGGDYVPCSDCPKHRIWQEGNMLKYTTW